MENLHHHETFNLGLEPVSAQLKLLQKSLETNQYPDYPVQGDRFTCNPEEAARIVSGELGIGYGSWSVAAWDEAPDFPTQNALRAQGMALDRQGRPLHPWFEKMATNLDIGITTGKGAYWYWGPNKTADNIVIAEDHILLIKRKDTGLWALPGGHVDPGEDPLTAAYRELEEETGVILPASRESRITYQGPVADLRATAHAWPETTAVVHRIDQMISANGADDATDAAWVPIDIVRQDDVLFGSHQFLVKQALLVCR